MSKVELVLVRCIKDFSNALLGCYRGKQILNMHTRLQSLIMILF